MTYRPPQYGDVYVWPTDMSRANKLLVTMTIVGYDKRRGEIMIITPDPNQRYIRFDDLVGNITDQNLTLLVGLE